LGTPRSVPVLAALLEEDRVGHAARYALEAMPYAEAGAALRDTLKRTSGPRQAGIIDSLGWRRDTKAVPLLQPLLRDSNVTVAAAAATALGRIGGEPAVATLSETDATAPAQVHSAAMEGLLQCAERLMGDGEASAAASLYREVLARELGQPLRVAAWRGLLFSESQFPQDQMQLLLSSLAEVEHPLHTVAVEVVRETGDPRVLTGCLAAWDTFPADSQIAVLDAQVEREPHSLPTIRVAAESPYLEVRVAAWQALADVQDPGVIPMLARAATHGEPAEKEAAGNTLARLRGPDISQTLTAEIQRAEPAARAALLRALGARGDPRTADVLLLYADAEQRPVRLAALASLRTLAAPETLVPLLEVAAKSTNDRAPILQTLLSVCRAETDKDRVARSVIGAIDQASPSQRHQLLPLLAELATPAALRAAEATVQSTDTELAKEALRVLAQWPTAAPAPRLLESARSASDLTLHTLALRGAIAISVHESDAAQRLAILREALEVARRVEEKKQILGQISRKPVQEALELALGQLSNPELVDEAGLAVLSIAESLASSDPRSANAVAEKVLAATESPEISRRAWALRVKPEPGGPRIREWQLSGPYSQAGVTGATAVFDLVFSPEEKGESADWQSLPPNDHVNLAAVFPGQENCVAYLKTRIISPTATTGAILLGSDDGIKVWLNGEVVHSNNVDRGEVPDQDVAPIRLRQGANDLLFKISQGGGGWSVSARIVGADGQPLPGLRATAR
jgi:HEAT repeat protein